MHVTRQLHAKSTLNRIGKRVDGFFAARSWRYLTGMFTVVLCVLVMVLPSAYVVETPGPTQNVLGESGGKQVIAVSGVKTHKDSGQLLLVTVNASGVPGYPVTNAQALWGWADSHTTVMPREAVVPVGQTTEEYKSSSEKEMTSSQDSATTAALNFLKDKGYDVSQAKVHACR